MFKRPLGQFLTKSSPFLRVVPPPSLAYVGGSSTPWRQSSLGLLVFHVSFSSQTLFETRLCASKRLEAVSASIHDLHQCPIGGYL